MYGLDSSRNRPTLNASPEPVRQLKIFFLTERAIARACEEKIKCDDYRKKGGEAKGIVEVEETHCRTV